MGKEFPNPQQTEGAITLEHQSVGVLGDGKPELYARICFHKRDAGSALTGSQSRDSDRVAHFYVCFWRYWEFNCDNRTFSVEAAAEILRFLHAGVRTGRDGPAGHLPRQPVHYSQLPGQICSNEQTRLRV